MFSSSLDSDLGTRRCHWTFLQFYRSRWQRKAGVRAVPQCARPGHEEEAARRPRRGDPAPEPPATLGPATRARAPFFLRGAVTTAASGSPHERPWSYPHFADEETGVEG